MRIQESVGEVKRFLRATKDSFTSLTDGKSGDEYVVTFGLTIGTTPLIASEVKSLLESINKAVAAFAEDGKISLQLDINHQNGFDGSLLKEVRHAYETSKKLEEATVTPISKT